MPRVVPKKYAHWTSTELERLRKLYPVLTREQLLAAFHPHPIRSILVMANKIGARRRSRSWLQRCAQHVPTMNLLTGAGWPRPIEKETTE